MENLNEPRNNDPQVAQFAGRYPDGEPESDVALFAPQQVEELRQRWTTVQSQFVDEPRKSVEEADKLVASTIEKLEHAFADARSHLEKQWNKGEKVSTEDLRLCFQHYRQFFDRMLTNI